MQTGLANASVSHGRIRKPLPVNIAVILAAAGKVARQLYASKDSLFALDGADEAHGAVQATWDIDQVADRDIVSWPAGRGGRHAVGGIAEDRF